MKESFVANKNISIKVGFLVPFCLNFKISYKSNIIFIFLYHNYFLWLKKILVFKILLSLNDKNFIHVLKMNPYIVNSV